MKLCFKALVIRDLKFELLPLLLSGIVGGGGVQLGPLGTEATNRPIVPAPGDYDN
jgi:hypothetical protein